MTSVDNRISEVQNFIAFNETMMNDASENLQTLREEQDAARRELAILRRTESDEQRSEWLQDQGYDFVTSETDKFILGVNLQGEGVVIIDLIEWNSVNDTIVLDADATMGLARLLVEATGLPI
jgi:hypothetical protein